MRHLYMGIDPGKSGAVTVLDPRGEVLATYKFKGSTEADTSSNIKQWSGQVRRAAIEKVSSSPQMGVTSSFTFGRSYGFLRGVITALGISFVEVSPQAWQKSLGCRTKGNKNITKAAAQQRWPDRKWTHGIADSALIAEWVRRQEENIDGTQKTATR